ncbi:hypothetical protein JCM19233_121 [Vibrio astriarenae]|nr:hypothetical protein JCM19233_121 [Vibrio sp. C7]
MLPWKTAIERVSSFWPLVSRYLPVDTSNELVSHIMDLNPIVVHTDTTKQTNDWLSFSKVALEANIFDEVVQQHLGSLLERELQVQSFNVAGTHYSPEEPLIDRVYGKVVAILDAITNSRPLHLDWFDWLGLHCITRNTQTGASWSAEFKRALVLECLAYIQSTPSLYSENHYQILQLLLSHAVMESSGSLASSFEFLKKYAPKFYQPMSEIEMYIRLSDYDAAFQIIRAKLDTKVSSETLEVMAVTFVKLGELDKADLLTKNERRRFRGKLSFVFQPEAVLQKLPIQSEVKNEPVGKVESPKVEVADNAVEPPTKVP